MCYTVLSCLLCPQARFDFGGTLPPESERVALAERAKLKKRPTRKSGFLYFNGDPDDYLDETACQ